MVNVAGFDYILEPQTKIIGIVVETQKDYSLIIKPKKLNFAKGGGCVTPSASASLKK